MAKFSQYLRSHAVAEWSTQYIRYKEIKKKLKSSRAAAAQPSSSAAPSHDADSTPPQPHRPSTAAYSELLHLLDDPLRPLIDADDQPQHGDDSALSPSAAAVADSSSLRSRTSRPVTSSSSLQGESSEERISAEAAQQVVLDGPSSPQRSLLSRALLPLHQPLSPSDADFLSALEANLSTIQSFYSTQEEQLTRRVEEIGALLDAQPPLLQLSAAARSRLSRQLRAVYRALLLLHNYRLLNYVGFAKILKKRDKLNAEEPQRAAWSPTLITQVLDHCYCFSSPLLQRGLRRCIQLYAAHFDAAHDETEARKQLEPPVSPPLSPRQSLALRGLVAACTVGAALAVAQGLIMAFSSLSFPDAAWAALSVYRLQGMLLCHCLLWVLCLRCLRRCGVNYVLVLELDIDSLTPVPHMAIFLLVLSLLYLLSLNVYLLLWTLVAASLLPQSAVSVISCLHMSSFVLTVLLCWQPLYRTLYPARRYFCRVCWDIVRLPFSRVTFQATFIANQGTSLMYSLSDLAFTLCFYPQMLASASLSSPAAPAAVCSAVAFNFISWWLASLPNLWRCIQCWKRYRAGAGSRNLGNSLKYGNRLLLAAVDNLYSHSLASSSSMLTAWHALWIIVELVNITYSAYWDIAQDWGLFRQSSAGLQPLPLLARPSSSCIRRLRLVEDVRVYYAAIAADLILRVFSVLIVSPAAVFGGSVSDFLMLSLLYEGESLRRSLWNFFRLENEHVNNVCKFRAIDLLPLDRAPAAVPAAHRQQQQQQHGEEEDDGQEMTTVSRSSARAA